MLKVVEIFFLKSPKQLCLREGWREESDGGRNGGRKVMKGGMEGEKEEILSPYSIC